MQHKMAHSPPYSAHMNHCFQAKKSFRKTWVQQSLRWHRIVVQYPWKETTYELSEGKKNISCFIMEKKGNMNKPNRIVFSGLLQSPDQQMLGVSEKEMGKC